MLGADGGAALVAGGASAPSAPAGVRARVLSSFFNAGEPIEVDQEVVLPRALARELQHAGKVEIINADPVPLPEPEHIAAPVETSRIRVLRSFIYARGPVAVGEELTVSHRFARDMVRFGKAQILPDEPATGPDAEADAKAVAEAEAAKAEADAKAAAEAAAATAGQAELLAKPETAAARRQTKESAA
jgi:hypothetical protein